MGERRGMSDVDGRLAAWKLCLDTEPTDLSVVKNQLRDLYLILMAMRAELHLRDTPEKPL